MTETPVGSAQSDWLINLVLGFEGFDDAQKAQIEAAIPALSAMLAAIDANKAVITEAADLYAKAQPLIAALVKGWTTGGVGAAAQVVAAVLAAKPRA